MEFFEAPVVVANVDEGGDCGAELGEVLVGFSVDDLLLEGAVEALDDAVGLRLAEGWALRPRLCARNGSC